MANLKELRGRIASVKSTQKITSAMKMVAAARLRRAQTLLNNSLPYNQALLNSVNRLLQELRREEAVKNISYIYPPLMSAKEKEDKYLLVVFSSDRGLCGGFNSNIAKVTSKRVDELKQNGKEIKIICIGKKARDLLKKNFADDIIETVEGIAAKGAEYGEAKLIAEKILNFYEKEFDVIEIITSRFYSAIARETKEHRVLPLPVEAFYVHSPSEHCEIPVETGVSKPISTHCENVMNQKPAEDLTKNGNAFFDYEPDKMQMLESLLQQLFRMFIFQALAHSQASEQGARMTSMDSATRNAREMIGKLTLKYNSIRQSAITTELIEIIAGAEAL